MFKESQGQTGNDFVILDDGKPMSDSEDEGPLVAPRNKASGDGRAHTPQKLANLHGEGRHPCRALLT